MERDNITFRNYLSSLKDERLIEIINIEYGEYTEEALRLVKEELISRGYEDVFIDNKKELLNIRDLLLQVRFEDVQRILKKQFSINDEDIEKFNNIFHQLLCTTPSQLNSITIILDKHYDKFMNSFSDWDVYGVESGVDEKFSVDLYNWNDWLTFKVKTENINMVGKDLFIACCLLKMTTFGFNYEEVERKVIDITSKPEFINDEIYQTEDVEDNDIDVHPWIRYWARTLDVMLFATIINNILIYVPEKIINTIFSLEYIISMSLFLWVLVEALLLSTWGTTPGKVLLGITVRELDGSKMNFTRALNRSASVWFYGMGCGVSIIELITNITSYNRLTKNGITRWDQNGEYSVSHNKISTLNIIIVIVLFVGLAILRNYEII